MKILVIGRAGQVARALMARGACVKADLSALGRPDIDLESDSASLERVVMEQCPTVVINAAAYTAVEKAESESERAFQVNASGAERVARAAAEAGAAHILFSTDYVFSGEKEAPYSETDEVGPRSIYGRSKLMGEELALAANPRTIILRTAWVFSPGGSNFVRTMLRLAKSKPVIDVVADQIGCPTYANDLADAGLALSRRVADHPNGPFGVYHCAARGGVSWAEFAQAIFEEASARGGPSAKVRPIKARDFPSSVSRPSNSQLDCSKLASDHQLSLRGWRTALSACIEEIAAGGWSVE